MQRKRAQRRLRHAKRQGDALSAACPITGLSGATRQSLRLFLCHLIAPPNRRTEDVAERSTRVGGSELGHRLLLFLDFLAFDGQRQLTRLTIDRRDLGVDLLTNRKAVRALIALIASQLGAADEAGQD